jgi:hypothetical protein
MWRRKRVVVAQPDVIAAQMVVVGEFPAATRRKQIWLHHFAFAISTA